MRHSGDAGSQLETTLQVNNPTRVPRQRVWWRVNSPALNPKSSASYTSSHNRTVLSSLPDATCRPSGLKHTDSTS